MMPYLYTMNYRSYKENLPMILPMYYNHTEEQEAYEVKNQFWFGTQLVAAPITTPRITDLNVAKVKVWLPEGIWYDIFTGVMYRGDRTIDMYRSLESIPVLAKAGAILPFTDEISGKEAIKNPQSLHISVFAGADGSFELYEDDNETCAYESGTCVITEMLYTENEKNIFTIMPAKGELSLIPEKRSYLVELTGYKKSAAESVQVCAGEHVLQPVNVSYDEKKQAVIVELSEICVQQKVQICVDAAQVSVQNEVEERCFDFLNQAEIEFYLKDTLYQLITKEKDCTVLLSKLAAMEIHADLYKALAELLSAR